MSSGKVLDDTSWSTSNGTPIIQWQANGGLNQQWKIVTLAVAATMRSSTRTAARCSTTRLLDQQRHPDQQWQPNGGIQPAVDAAGGG